jgi:polyketide biosynthesis enoyl-CoA hydratase PksI
MNAKVRLSSDHDGVFELTLDDPENDNRLSDELCHDLIAELTRVAAHPAARVLVLAATGEVFSGGATRENLRSILAGKTHVKDIDLPAHMLAFPLPIVAALEGHSVGGGLILALCCDIVIAAESSRYGLNFTDLGFTPGMGSTQLLPALVGTSFALEMMLTATFYKGRDLRGRGLFTHVVPKGEVLSTARDLARRIADKPRHVVELVKNEIAGPRRMAMESALRREHEMHQACFSHPDTFATMERNYLDKSGIR